jgi:hypothetical protein
VNRTERMIFGLALVGSASPAFAGGQPVPAPIAGVGIGAVLLVGIGYRALRARITK